MEKEAADEVVLAAVLDSGLASAVVIVVFVVLRDGIMSCPSWLKRCRGVRCAASGGVICSEEESFMPIPPTPPGLLLALR